MFPALFSESVDIDVEALARCGHHRQCEGLVPGGLPAYVQSLRHRVLVRPPSQVPQRRRKLLIVVLAAVEVAEFGIPLVLNPRPIPHDGFVFELFLLSGEKVLRVTLFPMRELLAQVLLLGGLLWVAEDRGYGVLARQAGPQER